MMAHAWMDAVDVPEERHNRQLSNPTVTGEAGKIHSGAVLCHLPSSVDYATDVVWHIHFASFKAAVGDGAVQVVEYLPICTKLWV